MRSPWLKIMGNEILDAEGTIGYLFCVKVSF